MSRPQVRNSKPSQEEAHICKEVPRKGGSSRERESLQRGVAREGVPQEGGTKREFRGRESPGGTHHTDTFPISVAALVWTVEFRTSESIRKVSGSRDGPGSPREDSLVGGQNLSTKVSPGVKNPQKHI